MHNDAPPEKSRPASGGEFTWPPTREDLDAIQVIHLDGTPVLEPLAVEPIAAAPAAVAVVPNAIAAPALPRRSRLRLPRRDDLAFAGVLGTSMLAIGVAASMQFSDLWQRAIEPQAPPLSALGAQPFLAIAPIAMAPLAMAPVATRAEESRRVSPDRVGKYARRTAVATPAAIARPSMRSSRDAAYARPRLIATEGGRSGKIVLIVEVRKNGKVGDVDVLSSDLDRGNRSHRDLQRAAVSAVKRWRYEPAMRGGEPTGTQVRVVVNIDLDSGRMFAPATAASARRKAAAADRAADDVLAAR